MKKDNIPSEEIQKLLRTIYDDCKNEDAAVRETQIRKWKRLKLLWEGFHNVWYSEVAHDWRIWDHLNEASSDQSYYDKPINVFKAYLETIIAVLSISVPAVKCYPDDADNPLDLDTAKAGDKIAQVVYRHNDAVLLWLHMLFINATEGMIACYTYVKSDKEYGTYTVNKYEDYEQDIEKTVCPICGYTIDERELSPGEVPPSPAEVPQEPAQTPQEIQQDPQDLCPNCSNSITPQIKIEKAIQTKLTGSTQEPKSRVCQEMYGGLYVKVAIYAHTQKDTPYLIYSDERDYSLVVEELDHLRGNKTLIKQMKAGNDTGGGYGEYEQYGRLSPQYHGQTPENVITVNQAWIRPAKFNILEEEKDVNKLKKLYPKGVRLTMVNDQFGEAINESLDDHWTLSQDPLSDYLHHEPSGQGLISIQDITNDLISLTLQTIEHGIGQTFADPGVLSFKKYSETEVVPGGIFPATPKSGKGLNDGFYELRTATLSGEVMPFSDRIQSLGQFTSGALPSLFGGNLQGSNNTASEYGMSQAQAKQRQQNTWKMLCVFWKNIYSKIIPLYIEATRNQDDEREVQKDRDGNFVNVFIRKAELEGKIGKVELEASENIPLTWDQKRGAVEKLMLNGNPEIVKMLQAPENIPLLHDALGLTDFYVPGEDDVIKQYDEIKILLNSEPISTGDPTGQNPLTSSVEIDPLLDNHQLEFEICRKWAMSAAGRYAKTSKDMQAGYQNVLLHAKMHYDVIQQNMMAQQQQQQAEMASKGGGAAPHKKPNQLENHKAPIEGAADVQTIQ